MGGRRISRSKNNKDVGIDFITGGLKNNKATNDSLKKCEQILNLLSSHKSALPFLEPVDHVALQLYDYPTIVKEPMDLSTIRKKLKNREYRNIASFAVDVRKIWHNSFLYNKKYTGIYHVTVEMGEYFEKLYKEFSDGTAVEEIAESNTMIRALANKTKDYSSKIQSKGPPTKNLPNNFDKPMSIEEKKSLSEMIKSI